MPVDANIALGVRPVEVASPLQTIGGLMQIKEAQARQALQSQQIQESKQRAADVAEQTESRRRTNDAQRKATELLADPNVHAQIRAGDTSALFKAGIPPDVVKGITEGLGAYYKTAGELHDADVTRHAAGRSALAKALVNIDPADPAAAGQLNSFKGSIAPDYPDLAKQLPVFQAGPGLAKQIDDLKKSNGIFAAVLDSELGQRKLTADIGKTEAEAAKATAEGNRVEALAPLEVESKETANAQAGKVLAGTSANGITAEHAATEAETKRHNAATEATTRAEVALKQKTFDATFGAGLDANGQPLSAEALKTVALQDPTAQAIAHYQIPGPPAQTRGGAPSPILRKVLAINPGYDGTQFATRNKVQQDFSAAGASGKAITSADTALAHLDAISKAGKALENSDIQALNRLANAVGAQVGSSPKVVYDGIVRMVGPELSKAVIGAAGGEGERQDFVHGFGSDLAPAQREGVIAGTAGLLYQRVKKQAHAYESSMGQALDLDKRLSPESMAVMKRYSGEGGAQASGSHAVGDTVKIGGKNVKITAIHPDGTFDGNEVK